MWKIQKVKVKNYNLNVTEVRDSDFKNAFTGIFNFTVGILRPIQYNYDPRGHKLNEFGLNFIQNRNSH